MGKIDRVKARTRKGSKRRFHGNRFTNSKAAQEELPSPTGIEEHSESATNKNVDLSPTVNVETTPVKSMNVSQTKIKNIVTDTPKQSDKEISGYRIIDVELLSQVIKVLSCPECKNDELALHENFSEKQGFASLLYIHCTCGYKKEFRTSRTYSCKQSFDVNTRLIYSMRSIGQGYASIEKFTTLMNMPKPMTQNSFNKSVKSILKATSTVAEETMKEAADELKNDSEETVVDVSVSADGSWQRRGYSSLNGTYTTISLKTGKVLDCEVMSRHCKACKLKENLKKTDRISYDKWYEKHQNKCTMNHQGSAGAMEVSGATRIFGRSIEKRGLRYTEYLGDGDSKGYDNVVDIYPGKTVTKLECVGHVQKRVGSRLRNLKKVTKNLGGKGKLTNKTIDRLQNYYGIAVRANAGNMEQMKKSIHASLFHVASSKDNNWHDHCPTGKDSWCRYQSDKSTGLSTYKPGPGLPLTVIKHIKPVYNELSRDNLLKKCLHGKTQNQNEAFNGLIWERLPKSTYVSLTLMKLGTYDAIAHFNIGRKSSCLIFETLGMIPGRYTTKHCANMNRKRLYFANYKSTDKACKRRKVIRGKRKSVMDHLEDKEGTVYEAGAF